VLKIPVQITVVVLAFAIIGLLTPGALRLRNKSNIIKVVAALFLGVLCSLLEVARIGCNPKNHLFQLHAMWHVLTSLSMYFSCDCLYEIEMMDIESGSKRALC